ncbi:hypothetical protein NVP1174O_26 [Vibrio phage 1.174.O._10N.261.55.A8]|nr:hypothetical protein NVP1174O_26 [Vibrio phage 1.174.O._10N.261.55.A8]
MGRNKKTIEQFICDAQNVHGIGTYDYSSVVYKSGKDHVEITCHTHGNFNQTASNHLQGRGCPSCSKNKRITKEDLVRRSKVVHSDKYSYELVESVSRDKKVPIICKDHGVFYQQARKHLEGNSCPKCSQAKIARMQSFTTPQFIEKAVSVHGNKYCYKSVVYKNMKRLIVMTCGIHGEFRQSPGNHLKGKGCPKCAIHGFKTNMEATLYILQSLCGLHMKIGISNNPKQRIKILSRSTPFDFVLVNEFVADGRLILDAENKLHKRFKSAKFSGFDGATEWFISDTEAAANIARLIIKSQGSA